MARPKKNQNAEDVDQTSGLEHSEAENSSSESSGEGTDNVNETSGLEHGGDKPEAAPSGLVTSITSEEQAKVFVETNYTVPKGCQLVYVTEDKNVFWAENANSAINHAQKQNLKLFRVVWQA